MGYNKEKPHHRIYGYLIQQYAKKIKLSWGKEGKFDYCENSTHVNIMSGYVKDLNFAVLRMYLSYMAIVNWDWGQMIARG